MDVQTTQKNLQQRKYAKMLLAVILYQLYGLSIVWKIGIVGETAWKISSLREHATNVISFEKKKNVTVNKKELK